MNFLLSLGLVVLSAFVIGRIFERLGYPKIIGYILTGILFSPNTFGWLDRQLFSGTDTILNICLGFIAFEVGGELQWKAIRKQENEILHITVFESLTPYVLIIIGFSLLGRWYPGFFPFTDRSTVLAFTILLAGLASPTDPTATLAVMHEYNAKGKVKNAILGVAALDDAVGMLLFGVSLSIASYVIGSGSSIGGSLLQAIMHIVGGVLTGILAATLMVVALRHLRSEKEGQWIVVIFSIIVICYGMASMFGFEELLACMTLGIVVTNFSDQKKAIFGTIERYSEELIFLFFFVLSGLKLEVQTLPSAILLIALFIVLRSMGKFFGSRFGAAMAGADPAVRKYTAGGLIPQGGIVIGLALLVNRYAEFSELFDLFLTVVMGATVIHELVGPILAKFALTKAGEISKKKQQ